jgi:hypothetical protein
VVIEHEDLKMYWTNTKGIAGSGIDDDKMVIDDIP